MRIPSSEGGLCPCCWHAAKPLPPTIALHHTSPPSTSASSCTLWMVGCGLGLSSPVHPLLVPLVLLEVCSTHEVCQLALVDHLELRLQVVEIEINIFSFASNCQKYGSRFSQFYLFVTAVRNVCILMLQKAEFQFHKMSVQFPFCEWVWLVKVMGLS